MLFNKFCYVTEDFADYHVHETGALRVVAYSFAVVHRDNCQLFAGFDVDEFEFAADDGTAGIHAHSEDRSRSAAHIDLCDGKHEFIFRFGGINPDTMRFEVIVLRLGVLVPHHRRYGDESSFLVFLVEACTCRILFPRGAVDDEPFEFGPISHPICPLRLVVLVHGAVALVHVVAAVEFDHLGFGPIDLYIGILAGLLEHAQVTGLQLDFRKKEGTDGHENRKN